jgi:hypothetical protein
MRAHGVLPEGDGMASGDAMTTLGTVEEVVSWCDRLSFSTTVARQLVHRCAVSEVLLTDWCQRGADVFVCAAQWSRSHSFYRVRQGRHDPLLLAETIRQVGLLLCHEAYQMPPEHRFVMGGVNPPHPAVDGHVVAPRSALGQQLFDIAIGQSIPEVPAHRQHDHPQEEPEAGERRWWRKDRTNTADAAHELEHARTMSSLCATVHHGCPTLHLKADYPQNESTGHFANA